MISTAPALRPEPTSNTVGAAPGFRHSTLLPGLSIISPRTPETLTRLYAEEPELAHLGIAFEPTLIRLVSALADGMTRRP
ncbi:hypothetical protein ACWDFL_16035 [Streptomyces bungoensis]